MQGDKGFLNAADVHHLHHVFRKVDVGTRCGNSPLVLCKNRLEILHIVSCGMGKLFPFLFRAVVYDVTRQRSFSQCIQLTLELIVRTVVEETERAATGGCVVDDFCHHRAGLVEEELVADTDFTCRLDQYVPEPHLLVQLAEQEHFYLCICLLLRSVQSGRKHLRVIEDEGIPLIEVAEHILETDEIRFLWFTLDFPLNISILPDVRWSTIRRPSSRRVTVKVCVLPSLRVSTRSDECGYKATCSLGRLNLNCESFILLFGKFIVFQFSAAGASCRTGRN